MFSSVVVSVVAFLDFLSSIYFKCILEFKCFFVLIVSNLSLIQHSHSVFYLFHLCIFHDKFSFVF